MCKLFGEKMWKNVANSTLCNKKRLQFDAYYAGAAATCSLYPDCRVFKYQGLSRSCACHLHCFEEAFRMGLGTADVVAGDYAVEFVADSQMPHYVGDVVDMACGYDICRAAMTAKVPCKAHKLLIDFHRVEMRWI